MNKKTGFTLIETIVYIAIFSFIMTVIVSLSYKSAMENKAIFNAVITAYEKN
ncbi:MAG: type II secretion system protein [Patescibacteria group bacterium]|nr:type II secretion system protein [Patescibacteria group bacterium]